MPCVVQIRCLEVDLCNDKEIYLIVYNKMVQYLHTKTKKTFQDSGKHLQIKSRLQLLQIKSRLQLAQQLKTELWDNSALEKQDIKNMLIQLVEKPGLIKMFQSQLTRLLPQSKEALSDHVKRLHDAAEINPQCAGSALELIAMCGCPVLIEYIPNQVDLTPQYVFDFNQIVFFTYWF